ncbi:MAG: electron transport complex subunit RsxC [Dehalococcoidales bacterium]|nr:electron transport complex subunit RsxC [Dehalococcoidales bacterium]
MKNNILKPKYRGIPQWFKIPEHKLTATNAIQTLPLPDRVVIPLHQHIGPPSYPVIKIGDTVLTGQKIGDSNEFRCVPVHATISGKVTDIISFKDVVRNKEQQAIVIESDGKDKWIDLQTVDDPESLSNEEIIFKIREAGIVGMGGAIYPAHLKLTLPKNGRLETLILNGCECEPYVTADHRVMLEYGEEVISGLKIITKLISPDNIFIAIEDNKPDAIEHLTGIVEKSSLDGRVTIVPIKLKYPIGARELLVKAVLNKEVPFSGRCRDISVLVHNVSTAKAIHDAVIEGRPFIEEVITVGGGVNNPQNLLIRVGTPVKNLIEYCGGKNVNVNQIVLGGPMMGSAITDLETPVTKGTRCLLLKNTKVKAEQDCIHCGNCLDACSMRLNPSLLAKYSQSGRYDDCGEAYIDDCIECGVCTYVCPANIPITQYIKTAKQQLSLME